MVNFACKTEDKAWLLPFLFAIPFILTYVVTSCCSSIVFRSYRKDARPPLAPYLVPVLGHALSFLWDTCIVGKIQE